MKKSEIEVGATYTNKGARETKRKVLAIGSLHRPYHWFGAGSAPAEDGVVYEQNGFIGRMYISSFARWCGKKL